MNGWRGGSANATGCAAAGWPTKGGALVDPCGIGVAARAGAPAASTAAPTAIRVRRLPTAWDIPKGAAWRAMCGSLLFLVDVLPPPPTQDLGTQRARREDRDRR